MGGRGRQPGRRRARVAAPYEEIAGTVAGVGLAADMKLNTTVAPFILRGVRLLGTERRTRRCRAAQGLEPARRRSRAAASRHDAHTIDFDELPTQFENAYRKGTRSVETVTLRRDAVAAGVAHAASRAATAV